MLVATPEGIYGARDRMGRTPLQIGIKKDAKGSILAHCLSFENFAYMNLGYTDEHEQINLKLLEHIVMHRLIQGFPIQKTLPHRGSKA